MSSLFHQLERGPGVLYGGCGGIWVMLMYAPCVLEDMLLARPSLKAMKERHPAGFPSLTWVLPAAGFTMDGETRSAAASITDEYAADNVAQATLVEGRGFQSAAVRAIISGIDMMTRSRAPKKVFAELGASVEWCVGQRPQSVDGGPRPAAITAALEAVRKTFG